MDIKIFQQNKTRKTVRCKISGKNINIQVIDFTDELYAKWSKIIEMAYTSGDESINLCDSDINELFKDFTNIDFTVDELNSILDNPNNTFKTIFKEIQIILNEMVVRFLQDKQFDLVKTRRTLEETNVLMECGEIEKAIQNLSQYKDIIGELNG